MLASFLNVLGVLIKGEFIVQSYSQIFESVHCLNCLGVYDLSLICTEAGHHNGECLQSP